MVKLGRVFGDMITAYNRYPKRLPSKNSFSGSSFGEVYDEYPNAFRGSLLFYLILAAGFILLFVRLFDLQVLKGGQNRKRADQNRITIVNIPAARGVIYDRNGEVLARNSPLFLIRGKGDKSKEISRDEAIDLEAKGEPVFTIQQREYPQGQILSHITGYVGEITQEELKKSFGDYKSGDFLGRMGVEEKYELTLRGKDGKELIEADAFGRKLRTIQRIEPISGKNLNLSISAGLSSVIIDALGQVPANPLYLGKKIVSGMVIVSNPSTGEILAMVSVPTFDPNSFSKHNEEEILRILSDKEGMPLLNRAIAGTYPPGSTFKIITASAGLEEGKITALTQIEDVGSFSIGQFIFPNWYFLQYGKKEGMLDVVRAIKRSNDIFFYKVAEMVGIEKMVEWMKKYHLGAALGIDLPGELGGVVPSDEWKRKNINEGWYLGDTYHLGIGQGYLLVTPLQLNSWTNVIANGGTLYKPHVLHEEKPEILLQNVISNKTVLLIKEGMKEACSTGGTGWPLFDFKVKNDSTSIKGRVDGKNFIETNDGFIKIPIACKTGTAEYGPSTHSTSSGQVSSGQGSTHAWFTAFAPVDKPEISVTVLVEGGGEGSNVAAPVAKKILEYYFR